ncbi:MAG: DNA polymerase Y family protein [Rhodobacteraceae bacterium]|nr:DNA polymerase Y family protein [Paracoccaceae bacterium]
MWFPRLASERVLRAQPVDAPFALTHTQSNTQKIYCLNALAEGFGLRRGMGFSDARVLCPDLQTRLANPVADARFLQTLARWSGRYCPWVGVDGDGLVLDVTGSTHLFGGDTAMLLDMQARLDRAGLSHKTGLASTRGAAWALARYGSAPLDALPVAALRLPEDICNGLARLGVKTIADLRALPRITLARRFGAGVLLQLDRALGDQPEPVSPQSETPHFAVRMTLPEPIGLISDITLGLARLLARLCETLAVQEMGARRMQFTARRVGMASSQIEVRFARPMRDPPRIAALFARGLEKIDSGYGIDQIRLEAVEVEKLPLRQITHHKAKNDDHLADLITRLGNRVGLENILRHHPADSHIPEKSFMAVPAAYTEPAPGGWFISAPRPLIIFPAEPIRATGPQPPKYFIWRRMSFRIAQATGPERIAPEWWLENPDWRSGLRDYWRVSTREGRRLWLFFTPQNPGWFVQGEFA